MNNENRLFKIPFTTFATVIGLLTIISGLLIIIAWQNDITFLKTFGLGEIPIKANLGACFLLSGLALTLLQFSLALTRLLSRVFSVMVVFIGILTILEIALSVSFGIDEILFRKFPPPGTIIGPTRMALNAAISSVLAGTLLLLLSLKNIRFTWLMEFCLVLIFSISFLGLVGFIFGLAEFSETTGYTNMAVIATLLFILMCFGILFTFFSRITLKISIDQKFFAGIIFASTLIIFISLLSNSGYRLLREASERVYHTQVVKNYLNLLSSDVLDVETGVQGYLFSNNEDYLESMSKAKDDLSVSMHELTGLLQDNEKQLVRLDTLDHLILNRVEHAELLKSVIQSEGKDAGIALFQTNKGKILTDKIRALIDKMKDEENQLLSIRNNLEIRHSEKTQTIVFLNLIVQLSLIVFIFIVIRRNINQRRIALKEIRQLNEELEDRVKERTASLIKSEERFRSLYENSTVGIYRTTPDGKILLANPALVKLLGYSSFEELSERNLEKDGFEPSFGRTHFMDIMKREGEVKGLESAWTKMDGTTLFISESARAIHDVEGKIIFYDGIVEDITERKQQQKELIKHRDHLEELVNDRTEKLRTVMEETLDLYENAPCGYQSIDTDGKFIRINNTELRWLGYTHDEVIGRMGFEDLLTPESLETFKSCFPVFMKQGEISNREFEMKRKDGSTFFVSLNATAIYDANAKFIMSRSTLFDVTDRKLAEEALSNAMKEAEDANKAKSEFLANMSHEIRTPMNAVLGYTELLGNTLIDQTQKDYINSIKSSGRSLLTLINDILDLSKIEAGKLELEYDFIDTYSFFSEFEKIFSLKVSEKGLKFILDIASGTPHGIYIDEARVRQIVFNLIGNAIKFTSEGQITLKVFIENPQVVNYSKEKSEELIDLIIEVMDTGIGISKELQEAIFEPFVQERDYKHYGGTGLGLAITRRLTVLMNGTINLKSEPGKGSTFTVRIPEITYQRDFSGTNIDFQIDPAEIIFEEAVILIADDVEHNRSYLKDALKNTNLKIFEAEDGFDAYQLAKKVVPDLIIADIRMPKMDGYQLLNKLKTDKKLKHIPVIAYSASVLKAQKERIHKSEFVGLLIKPVKVTELYLELMNILPFRSTRAAEPEKPLSEVDLIGETTNLPGLIHSLETDFNDTWEKFSVTQPIGEIREFGKNLIQLGLEHNSGIIIGYGKDLTGATESFNIGAILKLIGKYKGIIESLKGSTKNISYD